VARRLRLGAGRVRPSLRAARHTGGYLHPRDLSLLLGWDGEPGRLAPATEREALALPPFGRGLDLICSAVASTTLRAVRWDADLGVSVRLADQPTIITDPDPLSDPWQHRYATTNDLVVHGNSFALVGEADFRTNRPGWLVPLPAEQVVVLLNPRTGLWEWVVNGVQLPVGDLLHVAAGNRSGEVLGRGVLAQYREWLSATVAAEQHSGRYFAGGTLPPAVLTSRHVITQTQAEDLKVKYRQVVATGEPVVLPTGVELLPIVSQADKAQLVEARRWNAELVAMLLGIPPHKLGLPGPTMTYQNVETADIDWVRDTVARWADPYAAALSKWLLPAGTTAQWDWSSRMRADQRTTADVLGGYVEHGILTIDEARSMIGRPPLMATVTAGQTPAGVPELTNAEVI
jgi:HK97 family phage portal protein